MPARAKDVAEGWRCISTATTSGTCWTVSESEATEGAQEAPYALSAPDHDLLAWLLGCQPDSVIHLVKGRPGAVLELPRWFPFP